MITYTRKDQRVFLGITLLISLLTTPVLHAQKAKLTSSWIGNTWGCSGYDDGKWVQMNAESSWIAPDGTIYCNTFWDEAGHQFSIYKNGEYLGNLGGPRTYDGNGDAITGNATHIWATIQGANRQITKIQQYDRASRARLGVIENVSTGRIRGLIVSGNQLLVSDNAGGKIKVYSTTDNTFIREWTVAAGNPGALAVDQAGFVWVAQYRSNKAFRYAIDGTKQSQEITLEANAQITAIAVDNQGRLLIADDGPDQQVKRFTSLATTPQADGTIGVQGGVLAGPRKGETGPLRFHDISGLGTDTNGNFYITMNQRGSANATDITGGGTEIESYTPDLTRQWVLQGLMFFDVASADPANENQVYTKNMRFEMDYSKGPGQEATYKGFTQDRFAYPRDLRFNNWSEHSAFVRRVNGKLFMATTDMYGGHMAIYRFEEGKETAIPSVLFWENNPAKGLIPEAPQGSWIWRDADGDGDFDSNEFTVNPKGKLNIFGIWMDDKGDVWFSGDQVQHFSLQGLDAKGNPIYDYTEGKYEVINTPFKVNRLEYFPDEDVMYMATQEACFKCMGKAVEKFENWSKGNRTPAFSINVEVPRQCFGPNDWDCWASQPGSMRVAGDYIFFAYYRPGKDKGSQVGPYVYNRHTGELVTFIKPGSEVCNYAGAIDVTHAIDAFKRANGEYLIFVEEDIFSKVMMYRWTPPGEDQVTITAPANNDSFVAGTNNTFDIKAYIPDTNNSIARVKFYNGATLLGESTSRPWQYTWKDAPKGNHSLLAKAYDANGTLISTSDTVKVSVASVPDLVVTNVKWTPANVAEGTPVKFSATVKNQGSEATDEGVVHGGAFLVDGQLVNWTDYSKASIAPGDSVVLTANWGPNSSDSWLAKQGPHKIEFVIDDLNRIRESNEDNNRGEATMCVGTANGAPLVSFASPGNNATFSTGVPIVLESNASDCDGQVVKVDFFINNQKVGEATTSPYRYNWTNAPQGTHQVFAIATDNAGKTDTTNVIRITVFNDRTTSGLITARGENAPGERKEFTFDNNINSKWLDFATRTWIQYQFAEGKTYVMDRYTLTSANDSPERDPKSWVLLGSVDGVTWDTLDTRQNETFPDRFQTRSFSFTNQKAYSYYRFEFTARDDIALFQIAEIELLEAETVPPVVKITAPTIASQTAVVAAPFSYTVPAFTHADGQPLTYAITGVSAGLTANNVTRVISGTPTTAGTLSVTVVATDPASASASQTFTINVNPAPATTLRVLHQDADKGQLTNNTIKPNLQLVNEGATPIPYGELTVRYWLTAENFAPMMNLAVYYAQVGTDKVKMKYVALDKPRQGALGYIEYSFDGSAGNLAAGANSGPIQTGIGKQDWTAFNEADDYSHGNSGSYAANTRITAYRKGADGVSTLIWGTEPAETPASQNLKVYTENKRDSKTNSISTFLQLRNEGNQPVSYGDVKVRYYFTAEGAQPLNFYLDYAQLGNGNAAGALVKGQFIRINPPLANADTYLELSFHNLDKLHPLSSTGNIQYRLAKADWSDFNQGNDHSYQNANNSMAENNRVVVYVSGVRVYGSEPGAGARLAGVEPESELKVVVLGNPVVRPDVDVEVRGAADQPLRLQLIDVQGRLVTERTIERAQAVERQTLSLLQQPPGVFLLRVNTPTQVRTVKVIRIE